MYSPSRNMLTIKDMLSKRIPQKNSAELIVPKTASWHPNWIEVITIKMNIVKRDLRSLFMDLELCNSASASSITEVRDSTSQEVRGAESHDTVYDATANAISTYCGFANQVAEGSRDWP